MLLSCVCVHINFVFILLLFDTISVSFPFKNCLKKRQNNDNKHEVFKNCSYKLDLQIIQVQYKYKIEKNIEKY